MITAQRPFVQHTLAAITLILLLGALLLIWPGIIVLFLGVFLLLNSCRTEQETVVTSWSEIANLSILFAS